MARHRFEKGNPGGPGRPKGQRNKVSLVIEEALAKVLTPKKAEELALVALEQAAQGNSRLLGILAEYGISKMPQPVAVSGPDGEALPTEFTLKFKT